MGVVNICPSHIRAAENACVKVALGQVRIR